MRNVSNEKLPKKAIFVIEPRFLSRTRKTSSENGFLDCRSLMQKEIDPRNRKREETKKLTAAIPFLIP